jgi:hypothetical protein
LTLNVLPHRSHVMLIGALSAILSLQNPARDEDGGRRFDRRSRGSTFTDVRSADFAALNSASFRCAYGDIAGAMRQAL